MASDKEKIARNSRQKLFLELTKSKGVLQIEEVIARLDAGRFWDADFVNNALMEAKKSDTRHMSRTIKGKDGHRLLRSIELTNSAGEVVIGYKQEALFNVQEYKQSVAYHVARAIHHDGEARYLQGRCLTRYQVQIDLPFQTFEASEPPATAPKPRAKRAVKRTPTKRGERPSERK